MNRIMREENGVSKIGQIEHIQVYHDPLQKGGEFIMGRKGIKSLPCCVWVPNELLENITPDTNLPGIEHYKSSYVKYDDYEFICGGSDDLEYYKKVLNKVKNK